MKYQVEVFRDSSVEGLALQSGDVIAEIHTKSLPFAVVERAIKTGAAELIPIKESAEPEEEEQDGDK